MILLHLVRWSGLGCMCTNRYDDVFECDPMDVGVCSQLDACNCHCQDPVVKVAYGQGMVGVNV